MKYVIRIAIFAIIALGMSVGLWMYLNGYLSKSKASGETASVKFSKTSLKQNAGDEVRVDLVLTTASSTNTHLGISGVDLAFTNIGSNLEFLYTKSMSTIPLGFDEAVLDESSMTSGTAPKQLKRVMFVSKKASTQLQKSIIIPLYFKVVEGASITSNITVNVATSQVVGPPSLTYPVTLDATAGSFTVEINDQRAASVTNLQCDDARNLSKANCGRAVAFTWTDSPNEDGYKILKNGTEIKTLAKGSAIYNDIGCPNNNSNTYAVIAYNSFGAVSKTSPTVNCACQVCPTAAPPRPTPVTPLASADLIFRVVFPNAAATVNQIQNVRVTVLDSSGGHVCPGANDCEQVTTFTRSVGTRIPNTFESPQLSFNLRKNQAYIIVVKQNHTLQQSYKYVYLTWQKVLQCLEGTTDSGCGQLIEEVSTRPLYSGDIDGNNVVDQADMDRVGAGFGANSAEGDLNFDGSTDQKDIEILGKNFNKKGT